MQDREYVLAFAISKGIGPRYFQRLLDRFKCAGAAFHAPEADLRTILPATTLESFIRLRGNFDPHTALASYLSRGIQVLVRGDRLYPEKLLHLHDPPLALFIKGSIELLQSLERAIAIVGTRRSSSYGQQVTELATRTFVKARCSVISGLALGIDTVAHAETVTARGKTIAILGSGLDELYPSSNRMLAERILQSGGAIVSEYLPDDSPRPGHFVQRNRLIAALSSGVVVVEGSKTSGALITADYAADLGRPVYVFPMPITAASSEGPLHLYRHGALMAADPEDILDDLGISYSPGVSKREVESLSRQEAVIYGTMENGAVTIQEMAKLTGVSVSDVLGIMSKMEIEGMVKKGIDGSYYRSV